VTSAVTLLPGQPDPYQHIAALLTNTTRLQQGRQVLLQPGRGFLQALAAQLQPGCSLQRRQGCSGALKNVCISAEVGSERGAVGAVVIVGNTEEHECGRLCGRCC